MLEGRPVFTRKPNKILYSTLKAEFYTFGIGWKLQSSSLSTFAAALVLHTLMALVHTCIIWYGGVGFDKRIDGTRLQLVAARAGLQNCEAGSMLMMTLGQRVRLRPPREAPIRAREATMAPQHAAGATGN